MITLITLATSACKEGVKKYDWIPTECAPSDYPAQIYSGFVYYGNGKSIYIPDGRAIDYGWGEMGSVNVAGPDLKEAPDRITVNWISYAENQSYSGDFKLNRARIDSLFLAGYRDDSYNSGKPTYHWLKIGLAPGGFVVVWLTGINTQIEVGHFTAHKVADFDWTRLYPGIDMQAHRKMVLTRLSSDTQKAISESNIPFGYWNRLRKRYPLKIDFSEIPDFLEASIDYINKEQQHIYKDENDKIGFEPLAPPAHIYVEWLDHLQQRLATEIWFDASELMTLFGQCAGQQITVKLEVSETDKPPVPTLNVAGHLVATPKIKNKTYNKRD